MTRALKTAEPTVPESHKRKPRKSRQVKAGPTRSGLAGWRLEVLAECCITQVSFTRTNRAVAHHAARCPGPDHLAVARIVGQAVADLTGSGIAVQYESQSTRQRTH